MRKVLIHCDDCGDQIESQNKMPEEIYISVNARNVKINIRATEDEHEIERDICSTCYAKRILAGNRDIRLIKSKDGSANAQMFNFIESLATYIPGFATEVADESVETLQEKARKLLNEIHIR